jgi:hypothetical protein
MDTILAQAGIDLLLRGGVVSKTYRAAYDLVIGILSHERSTDKPP